MRVNFLTDFSNKSGLGNVIRSREIFEVSQKYFKSKFIILSKNKKQIKKSDIIFLDLPHDDYKLNNLKKKYLKEKGKIIALDYNLKSNIDVNIGLLKKNKYAKKNFVNLKYSIIRRPFLKIKEKKNFKECIICIGSSDIRKTAKNLKKKILKIFSNVRIIKMKKNFIAKENKIFLSKKIYALLANCQFAIVNGGTTMLELLYLKKYVIVYPQNSLERQFAEKLRKLGASMTINKIPKKKDILKKIEMKKKNIIDCKGTERIISIIRSM